MLMLAYAGFTMAQTVEDFEGGIKMSGFNGGSTGKVSAAPNPDRTGINTSEVVGKMVRAKDGDPWQGWVSVLKTPIDGTANKYIHLKIWKPRITKTVVKWEKEGDVGANSGDVVSMNPQAVTSQWEELVFNMSAVSGNQIRFVLIPDFPEPVGLTEDINIYFDDIYANNDPAVGSAPVQMIANYEHIVFNYMIDDPINDLSYMTLVENPDKSGVNRSNCVIKFNRDKDGLPWDGFWTLLPTPLDLTTNKYVHVKVWKPRVSPVFFKIEGGTGDPTYIEKPADVAQAAIGQWEDLVWDFSAMPATTYTKLGLQPDRAEPVGLDNDLTIYFDDIILNNDPNPIPAAHQRLSIDLNGMVPPLVAGTPVYIAGAFGTDDNGSWAGPGTKPANQCFEDPLYPGIYTVDMYLPDGSYEFKFFWGANWNNGDPFNSGANRVATIAYNTNLVYTWGVGGVDVSIRDNKQAGKIQMYPNPVSNELTVNTTSDISKVIITNTLGKVVGNTIYTRTINTSNLSKGMYFVTFVNADGTKVTQKLIKD